MNPLDAAKATFLVIRTKLLEQMPELADDPECLLDTLEGITDLHDQLAALVRSAVNDEMLAGGIDEHMSKLQERKSALKDRARRKRQIALHHMEDLSIKKLVAPDLTVTRKLVPPSVIITDEAQIPDRLMRVKREPDKTAIKSELQMGSIVPGATLSNGSETLQVKI